MKIQYSETPGQLAKLAMLPIMALTLAGTGSISSAQTATVTTAPAPASIVRPASSAFFLGQHMLYTNSYRNLSKSMFSGVRIWGAEGTMWSQIEPTAGKYDFTKFDQQVAGAKAIGFEVIHTLGQTPRWASARPDELGVTGLGAAAEPVNMENWRRYVSTVARRYKGKISAYEVMNEPRIPEAIKIWSPGFFSGTSASLATMTKIASEEVKKVDPTARIICPSMDGDVQGIKRLDKFLATGAGKYCDVIGFHYYLRTLTIAELRSLIADTKTVMAKYGMQQKPLWDTESGVLVAEAGYNLVPRETSGALSKMFGSGEAARFAAQFLVVSQALGVQRTYWFAHDTSWMGSTVSNKNLNQLNPFGKSLLLMNNWFGGRTFSCLDSITGMDCRLYQANKWVGDVYWGTGRTVALWKKLGFKSLQFLNGETVALDKADPALVYPRIENDVIFVFRP